MMFYVVHGYASPDRSVTDGDGPVLEVSEFKTGEEVEAFYKEFEEDHDEESGDYSHVTFRVIEGEEMFLQPVKTVVEHKLRRKL